jgi:hypothetical protein
MFESAAFETPEPTRVDREAELQYLKDIIIEALARSALRVNRDADMVDASLQDVASVVATAVLGGYTRAGNQVGSAEIRAMARGVAEAAGLVVIEPGSQADAVFLADVFVRALSQD